MGHQRIEGPKKKGVEGPYDKEEFPKNMESRVRHFFSDEEMVKQCNDAFIHYTPPSEPFSLTRKKNSLSLSPYDNLFLSCTNLATRLREKRRFEEAKEALNKILRASGDDDTANPEIRLELSEIERELGNTKAALEQIEKGLKTIPETPPPPYHPKLFPDITWPDGEIYRGEDRARHARNRELLLWGEIHVQHALLLVPQNRFAASAAAQKARLFLLKINNPNSDWQREEIQRLFYSISSL